MAAHGFLVPDNGDRLVQAQWTLALWGSTALGLVSVQHVDSSSSGGHTAWLPADPRSQHLTGSLISSPVSELKSLTRVSVVVVQDL